MVVNLPTRQRCKMGSPPVTRGDSEAQWTPEGLALATLRLAQILAPSVHWQEGLVGLLVPSQAAPQGVAVCRIRENCMMESRALQAQEIIVLNLPMTRFSHGSYHSAIPDLSIKASGTSGQVVQANGERDKSNMEIAVILGHSVAITWLFSFTHLIGM